MISFEYAVIGLPQCSEAFRKWKALPCKDHVATISGEWAQSPRHFGRSSLEISCSTDRSVLKVQAIGQVPSPIILVARLDEGCSVADSLPHIRRIVEKETPYSWPRLDRDVQVATWLEASVLDAPAVGIGIGRMKIDEEDPKLSAAKVRRKETAEKKIAEKEAAARGNRIASLLSTFEGIFNEDFRLSDETTSQWASLSEQEITEAVKKSSVKIENIILQFEKHADWIQSQRHVHRGYWNAKEASLRRLAKRIEVILNSSS